MLQSQILIANSFVFFYCIIYTGYVYERERERVTDNSIELILLLLDSGLKRIH